MNSELKRRDIRRARRKFSVRKRLRGTSVKPRMSVFKSNRHLFAQLIDDEQGHTLFSVSTMMKELQPDLKRKSKDAAKHIGSLLAVKAKEHKIEAVIFDRGHNKYHGLLSELANAARDGGLQF